MNVYKLSSGSPKNPFSQVGYFWHTHGTPSQRERVLSEGKRIVFLRPKSKNWAGVFSHSAKNNNVLHKEIWNIYQICRKEFMFQGRDLISSNWLLFDNEFVVPSIHRVISGRSGRRYRGQRPDCNLKMIMHRPVVSLYRTIWQSQKEYSVVIFWLEPWVSKSG